MREENLFHIIVISLLLPLLTCCQDVPENAFPEERDCSVHPVGVHLDITMSVPKEGIPQYEQVHELRIVVVDKESGVVDMNEVIVSPELDALKEEVKGETNNKYVYKIRKQVSATVGTKYVYALANAERLMTDKAKSGSGPEVMAALDAIELKGKISKGENVPVASVRYEVQPKEDTGTGGIFVMKTDIAMAYAAVKFTLSYNNKLGGDGSTTTAQKISIVHWSVDKVSDNSYLIPRMAPDAWKKLEELAGSVFNEGEGEWIYEYKLPEGSKHDLHTEEYKNVIALDPGATYQDKDIYYLHESRNLIAEEKSGENDDEEERQEYRLTLGVKEVSAKETDAPIILGPVTLPNLQSLVRGTHVAIEANIKNLPAAGDNTLSVRVVTWIRPEDSIGGSWDVVEGDK